MVLSEEATPFHARERKSSFLASKFFSNDGIQKVEKPYSQLLAYLKNHVPMCTSHRDELTITYSVLKSTGLGQLPLGNGDFPIIICYLCTISPEALTAHAS